MLDIIKKNIPTIAGWIFDYARKHSRMDVVCGGKAYKIDVRLVDPNMIGTPTHDELAAAETALANAQTTEEVLAAQGQMINVLRTVVIGRKED
ncbi:hypothetical protein [Desulfovibrio sp. JC010]|uniref:hypothetical protein n=1 Tax=Desulfovibrio sp. JC010 TaxID=2593641 RepID=UPI0013D14035|nr:hypothetical protein [Desulfovibrio sp. JC010]NDV27712.1 hypothetical protein [Desulfovibrio sp. JC010]